MSAENQVAYTFTGQGSQRVGMWDDLRDSSIAQSVFEAADKRLGISLATLCSKGPIEELTRTSNAQPAIVAHSLSALYVTQNLHHDLPAPKFYLGHSVGEFSALAGAGVIDEISAVYLVRQRGLLMERVDGQMAVVFGKEPEEVDELCRQSGAEVANINCPGQIVISGNEEHISEALRIANDPRRVRLLNVSGPFHSTLMAPLREEFRQILDDVSFQDAKTPVILNVNAKPETRADVIKEMLVTQLAAPVQWRKSVEYAIAHGVTTFVEFGPGDTLTGLLKRINSEVRGVAVTDYQSAKTLSL